MTRKYGWIPDLPDYRDFQFRRAGAPITPPPIVDFRKGSMPRVMDQLTLGSCTAHAITSALEYLHLKTHKKEVLLSRNFVYYGEREIEGTIGTDAGAMGRDGLKVVNKLGVPRESLCKYDVSKFTQKPTPAAYANALKHKITQYARIDEDSTTDVVEGIRVSLAQGQPVIFGFSVYDNFESEAVATNGVMSMPIGKQLGGHEVWLCGYDDTQNVGIAANSWSDEWGDKGYFYIPYAYLNDRNLSDDFWSIAQ